MPRTHQSVDEIVRALKLNASEENRAGMKRFGIDTEFAFGVSQVHIKQIAKTIVHDHELALALWATGIHEVRMVAALVDKPHWVTKTQMEDWVSVFNSWDICDHVCGNLFDKTPFAHEKIFEWSKRPEEFVKRAAFAMIAWRAVHLKKLPDEEFLVYFELIEREADDPRNFVKKAVNWALRQIGKRSLTLNKPASALALELTDSEDKTSRWIGNDAYKELSSHKLISRLEAKEKGINVRDWKKAYDEGN